MGFYRIKHLPTGMYFCPSRSIKHPDDGWYCKSNLSKNGKVYTKKPSLRMLGDVIYSHLLPRKTVVGRTSGPTFPFNEEEWMIEEL